jgi:GAF domain-containing protein
MALLNEVGRAITSVLDLDELLHQIVDITKTRFGHYAVGIALVEGDRLFFRAGSLIGDTNSRLEIEHVVLELEHTTSLAAEAARTGNPVLSNDVLNDPRYLPVTELPDTRSELDVPIRFKDRVIGVLDVQSDRPWAFDEADIVLLEALTSQAGVAIENARFLQERERRITEQAILNKIGKILSSALELEQVTQAIYEQVGRVFDTTSFFVALYDEDLREWELVLDIIDGERQPPSRYHIDEGITGFIIRYRQPLFFQTQEEIRSFREQQGFDAIGEGAKSWMGVPLIAGNRVIGAIGVESYEKERLYEARDLDLLSAVASQVAIALENAYLYQESRRRSEELNALLQVGTTLSSTLNPEEVMKAVCREMVYLLKATSAYICEWKEETLTSTVIAEYFGPDASVKEQISDLGVSYTEEDTMAPFLSRGIPRTFKLSSPEITAAERRHLEEFGGKSGLVLPLITQERVIGYIEVWESRSERTFSQDEILLGQNLATQAVIALENARLYARVQEQLEELRRSSEIQSHLLAQVQEMSTPVIPVHHRILVLPLIGVVDSERARQFTERLLEAVRQQRTRVVLLDITGVPVVDTGVAQALLQAANATRLLGAEVVVVGMRSEVAQTLVTLGVGIEGLVTRANLQAGLEYALRQVNLHIALI